MPPHSKSQSIWTHAQIFESQLPENQLTLGEGNTPLEKIESVYFKREDTNPTGSVKDRGFAYQISALVSRGITNFTLSSSGNAAISASQYIKQAGGSLTCFVAPNVDIHKKKILESLGCEIVIDPRAVSSAHRFAKDHHMHNLRPSQDPDGAVGYRTIAVELIEQLETSDFDLFLPVSSGTTMMGMYEGFQKINKGFPRFNCVQTSSIHPISHTFDSQFEEESVSLASAIVAKSVPRKSEIIKVITSTQGTGVIVQNSQIEAAAQYLAQHNMVTSYEGAAALAGYFKVTQDKKRKTVILLTGTNRTPRML